MEMFLKYLIVFATGGTICAIGQVLINTTKMTTARILVLFLLLGVLLESVGVFETLRNVCGQGVQTPIIGFGANLAKGAKAGAEVSFLHGASGGLASVSGGLTAAILFGFIFSLIFKSKSKTLNKPNKPYEKQT